MRDVLNINFLHPREEDMQQMSVMELAAYLRDLKDTIDEIKQVQSSMQKMYDFVSIAVLPERMDEEGIETVKVSGVGRLQLRSDIRCSTPAHNKEALHEWLRENGYESMIRPDVNSSTLKAFVKDCMKNGEPFPEELLTVHPYTRATVVKA